MKLRRYKSPTRPRRRNPFDPPPTSPVANPVHSHFSAVGALRRKRLPNSAPCTPDGYATHTECILHPSAPILHVRYRYVCTACARPPAPRRAFLMHRTRPARNPNPGPNPGPNPEETP